MTRLIRLDRIHEEPLNRSQGADDAHPMRKVTQQIVESETGWSPERAAKIKELFDGLASEWKTRATPERLVPLLDALDRGGLDGAEICCEVGCGSGVASPLLADKFSHLICFDLSMNMLRFGPETLSRAVADASRLPLADSSVDVLVVVNMFLFPGEYARVLRKGGKLLWASSDGDRTPIYLPIEDVATSLGDGFECMAADAGPGCWLVGKKL